VSEPVTERDLPVPKVALAIGAHPDDIEFGCGATLAKWASMGAATHMLILTDGSKGSWDERDDLRALVARREDEAREAATALGVQNVRFLELIDGELESGARERALVCEVMREVRPNVVLGHDPWKRYRLHPDHRHAGWLTVDGIVAARDPHFFPGLGGAHHRPDDLLLFEADEPNHLEVAGAFLPEKTAALLAHRSQWRSTMEIDVGGPGEAEGLAAFAARIVADARADGALGGEQRGDPLLAEAFRHLRDL
jgi:LmbE family N-acetylglucosaminyl deacetylase